MWLTKAHTSQEATTSTSGSCSLDKDDKIYLGNYITREVSLISGKIWFTLYNEENFKKIIEN